MPQINAGNKNAGAPTEEETLGLMERGMSNNPEAMEPVLSDERVEEMANTTEDHSYQLSPESKAYLESPTVVPKEVQDYEKGKAGGERGDLKSIEFKLIDKKRTTEPENPSRFPQSVDDRTNGEKNIQGSYGRSIAQSEDEELDSLMTELGWTDEELAPIDPKEEIANGEKVMTEIKNLSEKAAKYSPKVALATGIAKGSIKFAEELANTAIDVANWSDDFLSKNFGFKDEADSKHYDFAPDYSKNSLENAGYVLGKYFTGMAGSGVALKAMKVTGSVLGAASVGTGAVVSGAIQQQEDKTLVTHLMESYPQLEGWIPSIIVSKPDDTVLEAKAKAALESLFVDAATLGVAKAGTGIFKAAKSMKAGRALNNSLKAERTIVKKAAEAEEVLKQQKAASTGEPGTMAAAPEVEIPKRELTPEESSTIIRAKELFTPPTEAVVEATELARSGKQLMDLMELGDDPGLMKAWTDLKDGVVSIEKAQEAAAVIYSDKKRMTALMNRPARTPVTGEELLAMGMELENSKRVLDGAREAMKNGGKAEKALFLTSMAKFRATAASVKGGASEAGRVNRFFQEAFMSVKDDITRMDLLDEYLNIAGKDADVVAHYMDKFAEIGAKTEDMAEAMNRAGALSKVGDVLYEGWMNMLLSRPSTHLKNGVGNMLMAASAPIESAIAATISKTHDILGIPNKDKVYFRETYGIMRGYMEALGEGMGSAFNIFFKEQIPENLSMKIPGLRERAMGTDMDGFMGSFINALGYAVNIPGRALAASDSFFKSISYRARLHQLAIRDLSARGVDFASEEGKAQYKKFLTRPPKDMRLMSEKYAGKQTFTSPLTEVPMGLMGERAALFMETWPLGRVVAPFIRINTNLASRTLEHMPVLGALSPKIAQQITAGGVQRHEALSKMTLGAGLLAYGAMQYAEGEITAKGNSSNFRMKQALETGKGYMPHAIVLEDGTHVQGDFFPPFTSLFFAGADIAELQSYLDKGDEHKGDDLVIGTMGIIADRLTPDFLTEGMPLYLDFVKKVREGNLKGESLEKAGATFISTLFGAPFFKTMVKRFNDPVYRDTSPEEKAEGLIGGVLDTIERAQNQWLDSIGRGKDMPEILNIFGEPLKMHPGLSWEMVSPFGGPEEDDIRAELQRLGMHSQMYNPLHDGGDNEMFNLTLPEKIVRYNETPVELSPKEYNKFVKYAAGFHEAFDGVTLKDAIREVLNEPEITEIQNEVARDYEKKKVIKKVIYAYRSAARKLMIEDNSIATKLRDGIISKYEGRGYEVSPEDIDLGAQEPSPVAGE